MSAHMALSGAIKAALLAHRPLADALAGVFDAPPLRAATPHARIGEALLADWGTKDMAGREGRIAVTLHDAGETPARLRRLAGEVEAAMGMLPREIGDRWQLASVALVRARIEQRGEARWIATSEWRVRLLQSGAD